MYQVPGRSSGLLGTQEQSVLEGTAAHEEDWAPSLKPFLKNCSTLETPTLEQRVNNLSHGRDLTLEQGNRMRRNEERRDVMNLLQPAIPHSPWTTHVRGSTRLGNEGV